jgi:hypothetical protein
MTDFSTPSFKNRLLDCSLRLLLVCFLLVGTWVHAQVNTEITQLRLERVEDEWQLSAQVQFEIPAAVEDALVKGIPMVFVVSAEVLRERWYWSDKRITFAERHMRLAYQPLTRRWRLIISPGAIAGNGVGLAPSQNFDTLAQALLAIKRIAKWKIAEASELDGYPKNKLDFRFRLDLGQLPRPFQIGAIGQSDWDISVGALTPFSSESGK